MSARVLLALAVLIGAGCGSSVGPIPVECFEGAACGAGPCTIGHIHCSGRQPSCITTDLANGTACGDGKTCIGGFCVAPPCNAGTLCTLPDRKSTRLNSSHITISYAVFCLKKKKRDEDLRGRQNNKDIVHSV